MELTTAIPLALVLWVVYEIGKINGASAATSKLQKATGLLFAAKQAAEEETAQCKFACELFKEALKTQGARIEAMEKETACAKEGDNHGTA